MGEEEEGVETEMEVEMAEAEEGEVFVVREIDPDYEYDAPQHFDFAREESAAEAREAELWFESAGSYPPSRESAARNPRRPNRAAFRIFYSLVLLRP